MNSISYSQQVRIPLGLWQKCQGQVLDGLRALGLTPAESRATHQLLRLTLLHQQVFPSSRYVAFASRTSPRTHWRAVQHLRNQGLITVIQRFHGPRQGSNMYKLAKLIRIILRFIIKQGIPWFQTPWARAEPQAASPVPGWVLHYPGFFDPP